MTDSVIGALRVVLGADTAALDKGLQDSQSSIANFGTSVGIGMAAVAAAVAAAAYSIIGSVRSVINNAAQLDSLSQSLGVSVEDLSKLGYAASLSGIGIEQLGTSLGKLTKSMSSAAQEGAGPAAQAFSALGISVKNNDGTLKSSTTVLGDIADKFANYRDGAAKTALAVAIFGDAGAKLIPVLNQGRDGLADAGKEAENFGVVLDKRTTAAAAAFHENLLKVDAISQGLYTTIAAKLLPSLEALSQQFLDSSKNSDLMATSASKIADWLIAIVREVLIANVEINAMITQFTNLGTAIATIVKASSLADIGNIWSDYRTAADAAGKATDAVVASIRSATSAATDGASSIADWYLQAQGVKALNREVVAYGETWKQAAPTISAATSQAFQSFLDGQNKRIAAQQADLDATHQSAGAKERLRVVLEGLAVATAKNIALGPEEMIKLSQTANAAELVALKLGNIALIGQTNPFAAIGVAIDATNAKLQSGGLSVENYAILTQQSAKLTTKLWADSATSLASSFESMGSSISQMSSSWARVANIGKAIGATIAFVNSYVAASNAFATTPFPANIAVAASVLASGLAAVAAIKNAVVPTMATGGFVSGAGSSVSDSIPAMLSNGEFVMNAASTSRYRPQLEAMNSGGGQAQVINLAGLGRESYGREEVRKIISAINDAVGDGYRLNVRPA